jgi:hypothetical protein
MKIFTVLLTCFFVGHAVAQTNVFTVNNTPGIQANYTSLQGAIDSVPAGSVLLLQPSGLSYGVATINKPLVIYGPGYFLGQNPSPYTQARNAESIVGHLGFAKGSNGSKVAGLSLTAPPTNFSGRISIDSTSDITISRSEFTGTGDCGQGCTPVMFYIHASNNITVEQSYMKLTGVLLAPQVSNGILFRNNIMVANPWENYDVIRFYEAPFAYTFQNNTMSAKFGNIDLTNGTFINNVYVTTDKNSVYISAGPVYADHNVTNINVFSSNNNIVNADNTTMFVENTDPSINSQDGVWKLRPGSPAIGYGNDGKDAGAYGSDKPYVLSGIPAIPNIYLADVLQPATSNGGLKIHLRVKANQ